MEDEVLVESHPEANLVKHCWMQLTVSMRHTIDTFLRDIRPVDGVQFVATRGKAQEYSILE